MRRSAWLIPALLISLVCVLLVIYCPETIRAESDASDWIVLGLDVPNSADGLCRKVPQSERSWIRHYKMEIRWEKAQPTRGNFDWSYYDRQVNAALRDGAHCILFLVGGSVPAWAQDPKYGKFARKAPPENLQSWYDFCIRLAERYGKVVDFYEIWNEPGWDRDAQAYRREGVFHFGGQVESDYVQLLRVAYVAIKRADPTAQVISGAFINNYVIDPERGGELYSYLFGDYELPGRGVDIDILSEDTVSAWRMVKFTYGNSGDISGEMGSGGGESQEWVFLQPGSGAEDRKSFLVLENDLDQVFGAKIKFTEGKGSTYSRSLSVSPSSRLTAYLDDVWGRQSGDAGNRAIELLSEEPVRARLFEYFEHETQERPAFTHDGYGKAFRLEGAGDEYRIQEALLVYNPDGKDAEVKVGAEPISFCKYLPLQDKVIR